eukprot:6910441-Karenia_brevis.AAC.1
MATCGEAWQPGGNPVQQSDVISGTNSQLSMGRWHPSAQAVQRLKAKFVKINTQQAIVSAPVKMNSTK